MVKSLIKSFKKFTLSQAELLQKSLAENGKTKRNAFLYSDANVAKGNKKTQKKRKRERREK